MDTMQKRVLATIEKIVRELEFDITQSENWANTGSLYIMSGVTVVGIIPYNFQSGYCDIPIYTPRQIERREDFLASDAARVGAVRFSRPHDLAHALDAIRAFLMDRVEAPS